MPSPKTPDDEGERLTFEKEIGNTIEEWYIKTGDPVELLSQKEQRYINQRIDIREFYQPRDKWLRILIRKFKENFCPSIGEFINEKSGRVIDSFDLQNSFDGYYYKKDK